MLALWLAINLLVFRTVMVLDLLISYFQLLSITGKMNVAWPPVLEKFFGEALLCFCFTLRYL